MRLSLVLFYAIKSTNPNPSPIGIGFGLQCFGGEQDKSANIIIYLIDTNSLILSEMPNSYNMHISECSAPAEHWAMCIAKPSRFRDGYFLQFVYNILIL